MSISHASGCRQVTRYSVWRAVLGGMLEVTERGAPLGFSFEDVLRYRVLPQHAKWSHPERAAPAPPLPSRR
jgi:hypothetical protein